MVMIGQYVWYVERNEGGYWYCGKSVVVATLPKPHTHPIALSNSKNYRRSDVFRTYDEANRAVLWRTYRDDRAKQKRRKR